MRRSDSRIGVVAFLGATALVLVALIIFARYPQILRQGKEYRTFFREVPGLNVGDEVRFGGLLVGSITGLELDPSDPTRILVSFRVKKTTPVKTDTRASITQNGLLGELYLNLTSGQRESPDLPTGSVVTSDAVVTFQDAIAQMSRFLKNMDTVVGTMKEVTKSDPWSRVQRTLDRVDTLVAAFGGNTGKLFLRLDTATTAMSLVLGRAERTMAAIDTTVRVAGPGLDSTRAQVNATLLELRQVIGQLSTATRDGQRIEEILQNMSDASRDLARLSDRLEREPLSVLRRAQQPPKAVGPQPRE